MNRAIKLIPVIMLLVVLCVSGSGLVLLGEQSDSQFKKDNPLKRIRHFFYFAEANLYDGRLLLEIKDKIGLSPDQQEKIENLMLEHEAFSIRNSSEIKIKEVRFATYLKSGKMDRKEMEKYIREISREKTALIVNYVNYLLDVRALLTSQQLETLGQLKEKKKRSISRESRLPPER